MATTPPGLVLAGDGITDRPAGRADGTRRGDRLAAANLLLSGWGLAGHPLTTVPLRAGPVRLQIPSGTPSPGQTAPARSA